jgi:hypothetical protein
MRGSASEIRRVFDYPTNGIEIVVDKLTQPAILVPKESHRAGCPAARI